MADYSVLSKAQEFEVQFRRFAANLRVCMPGVIESFDAGTQRARVIPGVRMKTVLGQEVRYVDLPVVEEVPIMIPSAGGFAVTLPIKSGDPCVLMFADRDIENFLISGKPENPGKAQGEETTAPRSHHLTDAICFPGIIADPQVLPDYALDAIEMRDAPGENKIRLTSSGIEILTSGKLKIDASGVEVKASGDFKIDANNVTLDSSMKLSGGTFTDKNNVNSTSHTHTYVDSVGSAATPTTRSTQGANP